MSSLSKQLQRYSSLSQLQGYQATLGSAWSFVDLPGLISAIDGALGVPAPDGTPSAITEQGNACLQAGKTCDSVATDLDDVARNKLPAAWRGDVAETASQAVSALATESADASSALTRAGHALVSWAEDLRRAQRSDSSGRASLQSARGLLGPLGGLLSPFVEFGDSQDFISAVEQARDGVASMAGAASLAQNSGQTAAAILNQLAGLAKAEGAADNGLDPLDAVVLASEQNTAADGGGGILNADQLARAAQAESHMTPAQLAGFEQLLADAKSPEEAAFLMKALAAGNSLSAIEQFDALIHPYGDDPAWLSQHLAPDLATGNYDGQTVYDTPDKNKPGYLFVNPTYAQGGVDDCVAASTVVAQANLDPVFMLKLTTGNQPGVPGSDSYQAFVSRLQATYIGQYQQGQRADGQSGVYPQADSGVGATGETLLANTDLGTATGTHYSYVSLNGTGDNQAALPQIEQAVDSGQPVPIDVTNGSAGHQMVIIGAQGNMLEIYNPWGHTGWVSTQQFVSNQLGSLSPGAHPLSTAIAVELPSS